MGKNVAVLGHDEEAHTGLVVPLVILDTDLLELEEAHHFADFGDVLGVRSSLLYLVHGHALETVGNLLEEEVVYIIAEIIHDLVPVNAVGSESDGRGLKDVHGLDLILGASLNSDFALAGAVDDDLAENDGASARMLAHNALDDVAFTDDFNDEGVEHDLAFRLGEHTVHKQAPLVRIDIGEGVVAAPLGQDMGQCVAGLEQRIVGLFGKAAHYLLMARVEKVCVGESRRSGKIHLAAKLADALYKQSLCTASGRLKSRGNAGRAAAADYNIVRTIQAIHGSPPFF